MNDKIYKIDEIKEKVIPIAKDYGIDALFLFGSYAKGTANAESDVDFRVDKGKVRGIRFASFLLSLEESLNKNIDLVTSASLDSGFLDSIKNEEIMLYVKQR